MPLETTSQDDRISKETDGAYKGRLGEYARAKLAAAVEARKKAETDDDEEAYKRLTDTIKYWSDEALHSEKQEKADVETPNILKQAGTLFNNLK